MAPQDLDIYTEPDFDRDGLAHLGPLRALAGTWEGTSGVDVHPVATGDETQAYIEHYIADPIDPQTNGPQLFYGLRYHVHIVKPGEIDTFHDQVGYWLWEEATDTVIQTIAIPRAQVVMASGHATRDATSFELTATSDSVSFGICSASFLDRHFRTIEFTIRIEVHPDGTWSYEEDTVMHVSGRTEPVHHTDRNTMRLVEDAKPNPMIA